MSDFAFDLRIALRSFAKTPAFTAVLVLTLALGIGANTAIFTLTDQVLLRLLPVSRPDRLVILSAPGPYSGSTSVMISSVIPISQPMFEGLRSGNGVFSGMLGHFPVSLHLSAGSQTESVNGDLVTGGFFEVLGLRPALGRLLGPDDDRVPGGHPVVVLSHGIWQRRFASDPQVVGRSIFVNSHSMTVVGVAPAGFHGVDVGASVDVFVPAAMQPQVLPTWPRGLGDWRTRWLIPMARLKDGVSIDQAAAAINVLYGQLLREDMATLKTPSDRFRIAFLKKQLELSPGGRGPSGLRDQSQTPLFVLMGMVGLVLLIACANVANLLLTRASSRQKEIAVRLALGASRPRLVRQLVTESVVLAVAGGTLGLGVAAWTASLLIRALPSNGAAVVLTADPDLRVGLFALALAMVTGIAFGLAPGLQATRPQLAPTLKSETAAISGGTTPFRFRKGLVVAQIALSLLLLIGAGLFTRSLMNLRDLDPGFQPEQLTNLSVDPSLNGYELTRRVAIYDRLQDDIAAEPGVQSVSMAEEALMTDSNARRTIRVEGYEPKEGEDMSPNVNAVGPSFFSTMGIPLLRGRDFTRSDAMAAPRVAIVNELFVQQFFKDQDPIGRRFGYRSADKIDVTIVGVVRDGKSSTLRDERPRFVYVPHAQRDTLGGMTFYVRSVQDPQALGGRLRKIVAAADPQLPVTRMKTMRAQITESLFVDRMVATLSAAFGLLATLLAALGLYGVMSHAVAQRTREIGIRVALGAERSTVMAMVLKEVLVLALLGVAVGLPSGYGAGRFIESQLFGLAPHDPITFVVATVTLLVAALLAGYVPAARATRVDPMVALRYE